MASPTILDGAVITTDIPEGQTLVPGYSPTPETVGSNISHVVLVVAYSSVMVASIAGNGIVILSVITCRRMRTVTNYFIVSLAGADLMMAVLCLPFTFIANWLVDGWPFGAAMCPIVLYMQTVAVFLSAFTLVGLCQSSSSCSWSLAERFESWWPRLDTDGIVVGSSLLFYDFKYQFCWAYVSPWLVSASIAFELSCFRYDLDSRPAKFLPPSPPSGYSLSPFRFRSPFFPESTRSAVYVWRCGLTKSGS